MSDLLTELWALSLISASGVSLAYIVGIRSFGALVLSAVAAATALRTLTLMGLWGLGLHSWASETWVVISIVSIVAGVFIGRKKLTLLGAAFGTLMTFSMFSLVTKYVLQIGERHHSDSAGIISNAILVIQNENPDLTRLAETPKRGIAYALMLALGPDGRILAGFTPLVFLVLLATVAYGAWLVVRTSVSTQAFVLSALVLAAFAVTVPMVRAGMFYLNGHTLMGLGLGIMLLGLIKVSKESDLTRESFGLLVFGGLVVVTSRIEGIVFFLVLLGAVSSVVRLASLVSRLKLLFVSFSGFGALLLWLVSTNSDLFTEFGLPAEVALFLAVAFSVALTHPIADSVRRFAFPVVAAVVLALLVRSTMASGNLLQPLLSQWENLVFGAGGWGTAALVFVGMLILLGRGGNSDAYRQLLLLSLIVIASVIFTKTLDGGFGGSGFRDSINRMWLQVFPVLSTTVLVGLAEIVDQALPKRELGLGLRLGRFSPRIGSQQRRVRRKT